ncbi:VOC family protein [Arenicella sp. 4NH20-0111]|uniref:VOC family protein n=1 Tax=Arenicella sp. 4NH20-0111 TaxID=3127648 RepID=UPI0031059DDB
MADKLSVQFIYDFFYMLPVFHFAFNVTNLDEARDFYLRILNCAEGRSAETWVDINFFGHQLSLHLGQPFPSAYTGFVDGVAVPMPHFGAILPMSTWEAVSTKLISRSVEFVIKPTERFTGKSGQQCTMFFLDPFGNPIELKGVQNSNQIFKL